MVAAAPDRDPVLAVLVQQVQDLFGGVSGELLDVPRGQLDVKVRGAPEPRGDAGRGGEAAGDAAGSVPPRDPAAAQQRGDLRVAVKGGQPRSTCRGGSPPRRSGMPWSSRVRSTVLTVLSRCARCAGPPPPVLVQLPQQHRVQPLPVLPAGAWRGGDPGVHQPAPHHGAGGG